MQAEGPIRVALAAPGSTDFSRFGLWIMPPDQVGQRADYSHVLTSDAPGTSPRVHVNHVSQGNLPVLVTRLERHPIAWQTFLPQDVSRYTVVVAGTGPDGEPDLSDLHGFLVDGTIGVSYAPGVWHAGATVLDRRGHFAVLWPRQGSELDEVFVALPRPLLVGRSST